MCQPHGHFLIAHSAMTKALPAIAEAYPGHISFGCQGPDMFYTLMAGKWGYEDVADVIHSCNSLVFFSSLMNQIKSYEPESREHQAGRAYAYSFYSHVIADCIFHPYVNRLADNNWAHGYKTKEGTSRHKDIENNIDDCLLGIVGQSKDSFAIELGCKDSDNPLKLDPVIANLLNRSFHQAYTGSFDVSYYFDSNSLDKVDHTVHKAYRAYLTYNGISHELAQVGFNLNRVLSMRGIVSKIVKPNEWKSEEKFAMNITGLPWYSAPGNEFLTYNGKELYDMAINAVVQMINIGEDFLHSENNDALAHFISSGHPFLTKDYNLDTGLPSELNSVPENQNQDSSIRFGYMATEILARNYRAFV